MEMTWTIRNNSEQLQSVELDLKSTEEFMFCGHVHSKVCVVCSVQYIYNTTHSTVCVVCSVQYIYNTTHSTVRNTIVQLMTSMLVVLSFASIFLHLAHCFSTPFACV
jgi:hypothetical protein